MIAAAPSLITEVTARVRKSACCQAQGQRWYLSCQAMSTSVRIVFYTSFPALARDFERAAIDWIGWFEARYSRFLPDSIVGRINAKAGGKWLELDDEAETTLALCDRMHAATAGAFDAASLPLLRIWNWKAEVPTVPSESQIQEALRLSGWKHVQRRPHAIRLPAAGMGIDLGGIGKELAADHLVHLARERGISSVMVDVGGDMRMAGRPPFRDGWYIGLEEPGKAGECWTALHLSDCAIASSGDYLRSFMHQGRRFGHILDPRTGWPVSNGCQAVSVVAPNCALAGALSTAAFILGPIEGLDLLVKHEHVQGCITTDRARYLTRKFSSYVSS